MKKKISKKVKSPARYIVSKLVGDKKTQQWVLDQLKEGPRHKVMQNNLLFEQLTVLVKGVEKSSGKSLQAVSGIPVVWDVEEYIDFGVSLPKKIGKGKLSESKFISLFAEGPEHETLMYSLLLQVLSWVDGTLRKGK